MRANFSVTHCQPKIMHTTNTAESNNRKHVLIIKTGYSETLDPDDSGIVSLGDILRTTVILHLFPSDKYHVTWLVDQKGIPLLKGNLHISRLLSVTHFTPHLLLSEWFDIVINLEKDPGICAVADRIPAWRRYGFRLDPQSHSAVAYDYSDEALSFTIDSMAKRNKEKTWADILYEMLGHKYNGQPYLLGYRPQSDILFDVGLNHLTGKKFPLKRWPEAQWKCLYDKLSPQYSVCWQQGDNDIYDYIEWIASCRILVTNDSLGLHIALALGKHVVALFGPTIATEVEGECLIKLVPPLDWDCIPCMKSHCTKAVSCMAHISVGSVHKAVLDLLAEPANTAAKA